MWARLLTSAERRLPLEQLQPSAGLLWLQTYAPDELANAHTFAPSDAVVVERNATSLLDGFAG